MMPLRAFRFPRLASAFVLAAGLGLGASLAPGCLVETKCFSDEDCGGADICNAEGECVFECTADADCDLRFGVEFVCDQHHCSVAPECTACGFPNAEHSCIHGDCRFEQCLPGFYDHDGDHANGCEFHCEPGYVDANGDPDDGCECRQQNDGIEQCNDIDDDCDGEIDEDYELASDVNHCGLCGHRCSAGAHAVPVCSSGTCTFACDPDWYDADGLASTGCESASCIPTTEICNGRDDDCDCPGDTNDDGSSCGPGDEGVDEGFDKTALDSCGPFCIACEFDHASAACIAGVCVLDHCESGFIDLDDKESTGCEYECTPTGDEVCDSRDNDCDGAIDEGGICGPSCPADMVPVGSAYCIDRYEASRPDATATDPGTSTSRAMSRKGVLPWKVNPMTAEHLAEFEAACVASGKHLCTKDEWIAGCTGPESTLYVYGDTFDRETCNCVDTFCDDYCEEHGLSSCNSGTNCGYDYYCFEDVPTGSFPDCTNEYGTFDINGNVWEIVPSNDDPRGYEVRGGAYNCASPAQRVNCNYNANWTQLYAGFRCCKDLD